MGDDRGEVGGGGGRVRPVAVEAEAHRLGQVVRLDVGCKKENSVARWQNLIPSFPWIAPEWREGGNNPKGKDGIKFCSVA